jgi:hypothetical protein
MHPLRTHIARLRRQSRRLILAYGVAGCVAAVLGALLLLGLLDHAFRTEDRGVRIMLSLALAGVIGWSLYRYLWPALLFRQSDVAIARRVEKRFPNLADHLSSAISFLDQREEEQTAGSAELRRAVIAQTTADVETLRWSAVIEPRPVRRAGAIAGCLILAALAVVIFNPRMAAVGLERLAVPWSDVAWPRTHYLAFKSPVTRVAIGQVFEVELIDQHGDAPDDARIVYRSSNRGGGIDEQTGAFQKIGGALVARKENVVTPFEYRAIGGDDDTMDWIGVEVVEPPAVASVAMRLHPPAYTGLPPSASERRIEALRGTQVTLAGKTTRPIKSAAIRQENGPAVSLQVTDDGKGFALGESAREPWRVDQSGKYWIELSDSDGLVGGAEDSWDMRAIVDEAPRVTLERPLATLYCTPSAVVAVKVSATDDLAIRQVALNYLRSDQSDAGEQSVVLYAGPEIASPRTISAGAALPSAESHAIEHEWDLAPLSLAPGVQLTITAAAADYRPQTGVSQAARIIVLTPAEFEERIAARQAAILAEIARVLKMQQEVRTVTRGLLTQATQVRQFRKQDADGAHTIELSQRQVRRSLAGTSEGVLSQTSTLLEELTANRIDSPEMIRRVERIEQEVRRLDAQELGTAEQNLVSVIKNSELLLNRPENEVREIVARMADELTSAIAAQDGVVSALEQLLAELAEWTDYRDIAREVSEIQQQQRQLRSRTEAMQPDTLGRNANDLSPQQQADLQKTSGAQSELARRFDKLQQRMEQTYAKIGDTSPLAAQSLADAIELSRQQAIGSEMRDSARFIDDNRLGQSIERQHAIDAKLSELLDLLSGRREQELSRLVKKLRDAEQKLAAMRQQQHAISQQIRETQQRLKAATDEKEQQQLRDELARLLKEQQKLADETKRFARELERLRAPDASQQTADASDKMNEAANSAPNEQNNRAAQLSGEAKRKLDEAQQQLAERRQQAEQDLANEQLATVKQTLAGLTSRQESALAESKRLDALRQAQNELSPAQKQSLADLARNQSLLKDETDAVAEKVTAAEIFQLGVRSAAAEMERAAERLEQQKTGIEVVRPQERALLRLRQLLAALEEGQKAAAGQPNANAGQSPANPNGQPQRQQTPRIAHSVTEIKLLTVMQEDVNRRTIELQREVTAGTANDGDVAALAEEQARIVELVAKMTVRSTSAESND